MEYSRPLEIPLIGEDINYPHLDWRSLTFYNHQPVIITYCSAVDRKGRGRCLIAGMVCAFLYCVMFDFRTGQLWSSSKCICTHTKTAQAKAGKIRLLYFLTTATTTTIVIIIIIKVPFQQAQISNYLFKHLLLRTEKSLYIFMDNNIIKMQMLPKIFATKCPNKS